MASGVKYTRKSVNGGLEMRVKAAKKEAVKVGVLRGMGEHPNGDRGQTIAEVAFWNEFGTSRIPARPFLRSTLREERDVYRKAFRVALKQILALRATAANAIGMIGAKAASDIQAKITSLSSPANSPITIERKGSSNPLIDTGALRRSISWVRI